MMNNIVNLDDTTDFDNPWFDDFIDYVENLNQTSSRDTQVYPINNQSLSDRRFTNHIEVTQNPHNGFYFDDKRKLVFFFTLFKFLY